MKRTDFLHLKGVFNPIVLSRLREWLKDGFEKSETVSDRDKTAQHHGVGNDAIRFDPLWYLPWNTFSDLSLLDGYTLVNFPPQVRWVREQHQLSPWHQDKAYIERLGEVLTCFVPLDDAPSEHSTLEFTNALAELPHTPDEVYKGLKLIPEDSQRTHFHLELGDCLLFGDLAAHRTVVPMDAKLERFSFEYRLSKPTALIAGKDYFDTSTCKMFCNAK